jgi:low temperature requirement protein LtrA
VTRSIVAKNGHGVTFVELFFDLIFVFCVTQVVGLLHHDLNWVGVGHSILVFWLVWWAWTQFTWALNPADPTHPFVELGTLAATAVAFFMAVSIHERTARGAGGWPGRPAGPDLAVGARHRPRRDRGAHRGS